jgi:hypothetical protein
LGEAKRLLDEGPYIIAHKDHKTARRRPNWKLPLAAVILLAFITSIPQIYLWYLRGSDWNGSCAYQDTDELPYAAYTNALIDGRPRRNDPFTGKDNQQFETLFSIQSFPAYAIALPARLLGLSTTTAFIALLPLTTIGIALVAFWLLLEFTDSTPLAMAGAVGVLTLGTAAAHSPIQILQGIDVGYNSFPLLRRYIPAIPFPVFLSVTVFMWRALTRHLVWSVLAALSFVVLVFSYFFLWTATAAWLLTILALWFFAKPEDRGRIWRVCGIFAAIAAPALLAYVWLLTQRTDAMDSGQLLELSRRPDLLRAPELYGGLILCLLAFQIKKKERSHTDPVILFTASFAVAPFLVFNQQILTGRSLQPFHYEEFVANYWVVLAAFLTLGILRRTLNTRIIGYLFVAGFGTALLLAIMTARLTITSNVRFDEVRAVARKFRQNNLNGVVFAPDFRLTNSLPVTAQNPVLWSRYLYTFSNVDSVEQKRRYYQHLYFSGVDEDRLSRLLHTDFFARWEVFGADRTNPVLALSPKKITEEEITETTKEYAGFVNSFNLDLARGPLLSYAVVASGADLSRLDQWYERSTTDQVGEFVIYRLTLRASR